MQIEDYASMFRKQVFSSDVDDDTIQDCIKTAQTQSEKVNQNLKTRVVSPAKFTPYEIATFKFRPRLPISF